MGNSESMMSMLDPASDEELRKRAETSKNGTTIEQQTRNELVRILMLGKTAVVNNAMKHGDLSEYSLILGAINKAMAKYGPMTGGEDDGDYETNSAMPYKVAEKVPGMAPDSIVTYSLEYGKVGGKGRLWVEYNLKPGRETSYDFMITNVDEPGQKFTCRITDIDEAKKNADVKYAVGDTVYVRWGPSGAMSVVNYDQSKVILFRPNDYLKNTPPTPFSTKKGPGASTPAPDWATPGQHIGCRVGSDTYIYTIFEVTGDKNKRVAYGYDRNEMDRSRWNYMIWNSAAGGFYEERDKNSFGSARQLNVYPVSQDTPTGSRWDEHF